MSSSYTNSTNTTAKNFFATDLGNLTKATHVHKDKEENYSDNDAVVLENDYLVALENEATEGGILDKLINTINLNLKAQFKSGRIREENYGSAYVQLVSEAITQSIKFMLERDLSVAQTMLAYEQINTEKARQLVYKRQVKAFDDERDYKISKQVMDAKVTYDYYLENQDQNQLSFLIEDDKVEEITSKLSTWLGKIDTEPVDINGLDTTHTAKSTISNDT